MPTASDIGPLDWQTPIVDGTGRPSPEFQRRWNAQRANNTLIGSVTTGVGAPAGSPGEGALYLDISVTPAVLYVGHAGAWKQSGARVFIQLADVPNTYAAAAGQIPQVNPGATALQFAGISAVLDSLGATQGDVLYRGASGWVILPPGTAGQVLSTGGAAANPSWATGGGGGGGTAPNVFSPGGAAVVIPTVANVTVVGATGMTITNLASGRGLNFDQAAGTTTQDITLNGYTPPATGGGDFSVTGLVSFNSDMSSSWFYGICLTDSSGNRAAYGFRNNNNFSKSTYSTSGGVITFVGIASYNTYEPITGPVWIRVSRVGTNFVASTSRDGENFIAFLTEPASTYLGSTLSKAGFIFFGYGTPEVNGTLFSLAHSP